MYHVVEKNVFSTVMVCMTSEYEQLNAIANTTLDETVLAEFTDAIWTEWMPIQEAMAYSEEKVLPVFEIFLGCLLYTSDAADE